MPDRPGVLAEVTTLFGELGVNIFDLEIAHSAEGDGACWCWSSTASEAERARDALAGPGLPLRRSARSGR